MGIGSTAWVCLGGKTADGVVEGPRNVVGFELKESYHRAAVANASRARKAAVSKRSAEGRSLFGPDPDAEPAEVAS